MQNELPVHLLLDGALLASKCHSHTWNPAVVTIWGKQAEESRTAGSESHFIQRPVVLCAAEVLGTIWDNKDIFGST